MLLPGMKLIQQMRNRSMDQIDKGLRPQTDPEDKSKEGCEYDDLA